MRMELESRELLGRQVKAFLDIMILAVLNGNSMHGYDILASIHKRFGVLLSPGTLYPLLHSLERARLIEARTFKWRRVYMVNQKGKEKLRDAFIVYRAVTQEISSFIDENLKGSFLSA